MPRFPLLKSTFALALALSLVLGGALSTSAQGDETALEEGTPPPDQSGQVAYGLLQVSAVSCSGGGDPGTVSILLGDEYAPPGDCIDGYAALLIDGIDYGPAAPYLELQLETGFHTVLDPSSGAARDVEIVDGGATSIVVVAFAVPFEPTPEPTVEAAAETANSQMLVVAHSCNPAVQSVDQLYALGGLTDRLNACPAFTLPGYPGPDGTATGGELSYDFTLTPATGDPQSLTGNGSFESDAFCESTVGALDNDPTNDRCVSTSGFAFELPEEATALTQTLNPDTMRYVAAETGDDADAAVITGSDPSSGYLGLDTSLRGTDRPVIHLYYLNPPRVNVVMHFCGPEIDSPDALQGLGSLAAQLLACPASARSAEGGGYDFGVTVSDNNWGARAFDSSSFVPTIICESDIGDWNGDTSDNACVDAPTYRFDQTAQGHVTVTQDYAPDGYAFGGANSASGAIAAVDQGAATVSLDTSFDGDVTLHLFDLVAAPAATLTPIPSPTNTVTPIPPAPTRSPTSPAATQTPVRTATAQPPTATVPTGSTTETGTVTVAALYCLSGSGTSIVALAPGQQASESDLGGSSCFAGDASIQLTLFGAESVPALKLGRDGVEAIQGVPVTSGATGSHIISEDLTGQSASFDVDAGAVTRVIIRFGAGTAMVDEGVTSTGGAPGSTTGAPGSTTSSTGGLVTDELIGDDGASFPGSYDGISYTSLIVEDVDAQKVSSVKDAKSLPAVGVVPLDPMHQYLALAAALSILTTAVALAARRPPS